MFSILTAVNVDFLDAILYYGFARCYRGGKLGKKFMGILYINFYNCLWIYSYLKTKILIKKPSKKYYGKFYLFYSDKYRKF